MNLEYLRQKMDAQKYVYDDTLVTVLAVALQLQRPLLIEGAAGVGKTEIAKVMAAALDRDLVRLQCYEGLEESKALYEWNYQKQLPDGTVVTKVAYEVSVSRLNALREEPATGYDLEQELAREFHSAPARYPAQPQLSGVRE